MPFPHPTVRDALAPHPGVTRRSQVLETAVFLLLVMPSVAVSFFAARHGALTFTMIAVSTIIRDLSLVTLILYFLWRNGEPRAFIGWTSRNAAREILLGALLFFPLAMTTGGLAWLLGELGMSLPAERPAFLIPHGTWGTALAVLLVITVAVAEETIFRGYLILRFAAALRSTGWAVALSSAVFSLGHGYEGSAGLVAIGALGALYAVIYLWRGSLVAPVTMHFLQNLVSLVLAPDFTALL